MSRIAVIVCEITAMLKGLGEASVSPFCLQKFSRIITQPRQASSRCGFPIQNPVLRFRGFLYFLPGNPYHLVFVTKLLSVCLLCVERGCREVSPFSFIVTINFHKKKCEIFEKSKFVIIFASTKTNIRQFSNSTQ